MSNVEVNISFAVQNTRVKVTQPVEDKEKEYETHFDANYVDGFRAPRAYISTTGPMRNTHNIFWKMVYEQDVRIIVMISHLQEGGKVMCDQYWPEKGNVIYGDISVTSVRDDVLAFYTLRTFNIEQIALKTTKKQKTEQKAVHTVYQYQYTAWPDYGVPLHALPLISFIRNSAAANADSRPPIVIHCRYEDENFDSIKS